MRTTRAYREEEGPPAQGLAVAGICALAVGLGWGFHRCFFRGYGMEALDLAQLGRNLSQGQGFSTDFVRPILLSHLRAGKPVPDLSNAPLYPLLLGLLLAFGGEGDRTVAMLPVLLLALSASLLFALARRLSRSGWVAGLAAGAYLLAPPVLAAVDAARPIILSTCLLLWLLLSMTPFQNKSGSDLQDESATPSPLSLAMAAKKQRRRALWLGVLLGLCYLADYFSLLYTLPLLWLWRREATATSATATSAAATSATATSAAATSAADGTEPVKRAVWGHGTLAMAAPMLLGAALVVLPWGWRNFVLAGNPFYSTQWLELQMQTPQTSGLSLLRDASGIAAVWPGPGALALKWARALARLVLALPFLPHLLLTPFVGCAFFLKLEAARLNRIKPAILLALASYIVGLSLLGRAAAALLPLVPLLCLLGAAAYGHIIAAWLRRLEAGSAPDGNSRASPGLALAQRLRPLAPALRAALPLALLGAPLAARMAHPGAPGPGEGAVRAAFEPISAAVPADAASARASASARAIAIASDVPWAIAWYANRRAVWLPNTRAELARIEAKQPLAAIYLSPALGDAAGELTGAQQWQAIYWGAQSLEGFDRNPRAALRDVLFVKRPSLDEISRMARAQPKTPEVQLQLGQTQLLAGHYREALVTFEALQKLYPQAPHGYWGAGKALYGLKAYDRSLAAFAQAIARARDVPALRLEARLQSADILNSRRDFGGAASLYEAVLADQPENPVALNNLAFLYAADGKNLDRALKMARRAAAANPRSGSIRDTLGWVCFRLKRYPEAVAQLRQASRLEPKSAIVQAHLKQALAAAGQN